jgi:hypothetical protein
VSTTLKAKEYMSFDLGKASHSQVISLLKNSNANFETDYGYKGYKDLLLIKVNNYNKLSKYGTISSAWLSFAPDKSLYKFEVTYRDAGKIFHTFKDALESKYSRINTSNAGFNKSTTYLDGETKITLKRNEFGFGSDQKTSLVYEYKPSLSTVFEMKKLIDKTISSKNAEKAADL